MLALQTYPPDLVYVILGIQLSASSMLTSTLPNELHSQLPSIFPFELIFHTSLIYIPQGAFRLCLQRPSFAKRLRHVVGRTHHTRHAGLHTPA